MHIDVKAFVKRKNKQKVSIFYRSMDFVDLGSRRETLDESNKHRGAVDFQKNTKRSISNVLNCKARKATKARVGDIDNNTIHEKVCTEQFVLFWGFGPFWTYKLNYL